MKRSKCYGSEAISVFRNPSVWIAIATAIAILYFGFAITSYFNKIVNMATGSSSMSLIFAGLAIFLVWILWIRRQ